MREERLGETSRSQFERLSSLKNYSKIRLAGFNYFTGPSFLAEGRGAMPLV
jgi:hypothetical protein